MAFGALHTGTEEQLGKRFHAFMHIGCGAVEVRRRIGQRAAAGGQYIAHELVVWHVFAIESSKSSDGKLLVDRIVTDTFAGQSQPIAPLERPKLGILRIVQQAIESAANASVDLCSYKNCLVSSSVGSSPVTPATASEKLASRAEVRPARKLELPQFGVRPIRRWGLYTVCLSTETTVHLLTNIKGRVSMVFENTHQDGVFAGADWR